MKKAYYTKCNTNYSEMIKIKITDIKLLIIAANFLVFIVFTPFFAKAQETSNLVECINYALENNIELNLSYNSAEKQRVTVLESKAGILPTLNLGSELYMSFGRNIDGNTNDITFEQTITNTYWLRTSVNLFQGLIKLNTIRFNKYLLSAIKEEASYIKNKLVYDVLVSYCTVSYSKGLADVAQSQVVLSEMQYKRMQKFVDIGRESPITVQELKSQWASDKLTLTLAQNNYSSTQLELKQLLRLGANQAFKIDTISLIFLLVTPEKNIDSLFGMAVNVLPEIKQQEFLFQASIKDLAIAKGGMLPRIYMSAGVNTNYFDKDPLGYSDQISNNQNQGIVMGISIPILNYASVNSNIKRKRSTINDRKLLLQKQRDKLYAEIWKAVDELQSAKNEYQSALELLYFSKLSLKNVSTKLEKGLANTTEYEAAKQRFISAKASLLKAKLIYYMRMQMLRFYETGNWKHIDGSY
ncbi:MAG: TolC family protein [Bacteroidetes bacterium]|nr:TolC family protein [Bacteroidota bacterium]